MFRNVKKYFAQTLTAALLFALVSPVAAQDDSMSRKLTDSKPGQDWYMSLGLMTNYFTMGPDIEEDAALVSNLFSGKALNVKTLQYDVHMSMTADDSIKRTDTYFLPTIDIGFGYRLGKHTIELDMELMGLKMNTVNEKTGMTITETGTSDTMETMGFVNSGTRTGRYDLKVTLNEDIWIVSPMAFYDYAVMEERWGRISAGGGLGLMFISMRQRMVFTAQRTDVGPSPLDSRLIEAETTITSIGDFGPLLRLCVAYRKSLTSSMNLQVRMGINYGYVTLNKHVDGSTMMYAGDALKISSPVSSMTVDGQRLENDDTSKMELLGAFIQAGIQF